MDRTAHELGCVAMTFNFRGCGESEGNFSLQGWVDDLRNAIAHVLSLHEPTGIILVGTNTGGSTRSAWPPTILGCRRRRC